MLAGLPQPLALLEVSEAAGLCLLPDYYAYDYGVRRVAPAVVTDLPPPVFTCRAGASTPAPRRNVDVVWRAGLDLHPLPEEGAGGQLLPVRAGGVLGRRMHLGQSEPEFT